MHQWGTVQRLQIIWWSKRKYQNGYSHSLLNRETDSEPNRDGFVFFNGRSLRNRSIKCVADGLSIKLPFPLSLALQLPPNSRRALKPWRFYRAVPLDIRPKHHEVPTIHLMLQSSHFPKDRLWRHGHVQRQSRQNPRRWRTTQTIVQNSAKTLDIPRVRLLLGQDLLWPKYQSFWESILKAPMTPSDLVYGAVDHCPFQPKIYQRSLASDLSSRWNTPCNAANTELWYTFNEWLNKWFE